MPGPKAGPSVGGLGTRVASVDGRRMATMRSGTRRAPRPRRKRAEGLGGGGHKRGLGGSLRREK